MQRVFQRIFNFEVKEKKEVSYNSGDQAKLKNRIEQNGLLK
jgi:hypothetical protein